MVMSNTKKREKKYCFLENMFCFFREMCVREPVAALCFVLAVASGVLLPYLSAGLPKLVLTGLENEWTLSLFLGRLLVLAAVTALVGIIRSGTGIYMETRTCTIPDLYNLQIMKKRLSVDYEVLENERFHNEAYAAYDAIYRHHSELRHGYTIWKDFLVAALSVALYGGILFTQSAGILILVVLPTLTASLLQKRARAYDKKMRHFAEAANRKMDYVARLTADLRAGKDIRIFDLSGWLLGILKKERKISEGYVKRWENAYLAANCVDSVLNFVRDGCAYVFLIVRIVRGEMAVSDFVWYMAMVAGAQQACSQLLALGERVGRLNLDYGRIRQFLDSWDGTAFSGKRQLPDKGSSDEKEFSDKKKTQGVQAAEIIFRHVSFVYPESQDATLRDISFTIRPGEKIALVGLNGAGKTTLVKLLCGLYHPTEGEILINRRNVREYDRESYYGMISAVFQNVKLLPLSIAQNVASAPESGMNQAGMDPERVRWCLKLAGLWEKVESLLRKENTSLGRRVCAQAVDLSGGEMQKLWMARALYKEAPILVLDEPTAALDPLAEQEVYEKYREMSAGRTSVFISHRLSSTSFCDRIFFMEKGQITEVGSHQALLERGGAYAELYQIQSQYYREEDAEICGE
ncbi:MAG: ABC transporter ATP-binding protein/permease [Lachnospiraceae bacterium]